MSERQTELKIDIGGEQVLLQQVEAVEALGEPFQISVDVIAPLGELDILPHLGKPACVTLKQDGELQRYFHGFVVEGEFTRESAEGFHYRLQLRPWTHFLAHNQDYAIFQEMTAVEIINQVLIESGMAEVRYELAGSYKPRDYCVQYGESDFAFVSRLMEEEGIYYFFEHDAERHVMIVVDSPHAHPDANPATLTYNPATEAVFNADTAARSSSVEKQFIQSWVERVSSGGEHKVTLRDFDFTRPDQPLEHSRAADKAQHQKDAQEVYDYPAAAWAPGGSIHPEDLPQSTSLMLQSLRSERRTYRGQSQVSGLSCGTVVDLDGHPTKRLNASYLITQTFHSITAERYRTGAGAGEESYNVIIGAIPLATPWRPAQLTPRPIVHGLESAIVTGPSGEEIFTDEYGRVKVRFHWDRSGSPGEKSTCWLRVSQTGGLGNIILPRVGHEVLVDFLGGDPDRPVVVGRVFNKSHMPIYKLPDNKTRALWRTKTYGSQSPYGKAKEVQSDTKLANEIRFEDKGGAEEIFVHAERDLNTRVRHMETHTVGHDQTINIGYDRSETVGHDETVTVTNDRSHTIGNDDSLSVGHNQTVTVAQDITVTAGKSITLKCGASKIVMDVKSITLESPMITIDGKAQLQAKSPMTSVNGTATLILKGGMTMIN